MKPVNDLQHPNPIKGIDSSIRRIPLVVYAQLDLGIWDPVNAAAEGIWLRILEDLYSDKDVS